MTTFPGFFEELFLHPGNRIEWGGLDWTSHLVGEMAQYIVLVESAKVVSSFSATNSLRFEMWM